MHLRHQALRAALLAALLVCGGCARVLGTLFAPHQTAMATANQVTDTVAAPVRGEAAELSHEVDRMLAGRPASGGNRDELSRIRDELDRRRAAASGRGGAVQDEPGRLAPWHPRMSARSDAAPDLLEPSPPRWRLMAARSWRDLPPPGPLPDGIAAADMPPLVELGGRRLGLAP